MLAFFLVALLCTDVCVGFAAPNHHFFTFSSGGGTQLVVQPYHNFPGIKMQSMIVYWQGGRGGGVVQR